MKTEIKICNHTGSHFTSMRFGQTVFNIFRFFQWKIAHRTATVRDKLNQHVDCRWEDKMLMVKSI